MADIELAGSEDDVVRAGGGVVWRTGPGGHTEVLVVHRPKYGDWSLPKGKVEPGETEAEAALREVEEETGLRCLLGPELPSTSYHDRKGRFKTVRYWVMTVESGSFAPNEEVDAGTWMTVGEAKERLSYQRDGDVLDSFAGVG